MQKRSVIVCGVGSLLALVAGSVILAIAIIGHVNLSSIAFAVMGALFVLGFVFGFVAWLLGLMHAARIGRWDWFVAVLLLSMPGALIYGISGPAGRSYTLTSTERRHQGASMRY